MKTIFKMEDLCDDRLQDIDYSITHYGGYRCSSNNTISNKFSMHTKKVISFDMHFDRWNIKRDPLPFSARIYHKKFNIDKSAGTPVAMSILMDLVTSYFH